jgi:hypothetical protein
MLWKRPEFPPWPAVMIICIDLRMSHAFQNMAKQRQRDCQALALSRILFGPVL